MTPTVTGLSNCFAGASVVEDGLTGLVQSRFVQQVPDAAFLDAVKDGSHHLDAQFPGSAAQMHFQHLSDVSYGWARPRG